MLHPASGQGQRDRCLETDQWEGREHKSLFLVRLQRQDPEPEIERQQSKSQKQRA